ncbi:hypothetical protein [Pararhizobium arenae]|uniref:hypothetical protein n=1 Tax=Pararhizobium arenae TaxID=1856850 RepID=UPI00094B7159|nr:hypothetical protein [Pararhizobium arenae]
MTNLPDFAHIKLTGRPLIICDIDEVVLEFVTPLGRFLVSEGYNLIPRSFALTGNIISNATGEAATEQDVKSLLDRFFTAQEAWQVPAPNAVSTLAALSRDADLVFLTAMPARHAAVRRVLLDRHDLIYPLLATEGPKGAVIKALRESMPVPCAFIDDIARNLLSVREHVPECLLINLMVNDDFRAMAPAPGPGIYRAANWDDVAALVSAHLFGKSEKWP